jgi:hypothetical protein
MQLPKGVTGFYDRGEAAPPIVDTRVFTAVCHDAMRSIGGKVLKKVLKVDEIMMFRNYYRAHIQLANGTVRQIVCNKHHPLLAVALEATEVEGYPQFIDEPALASAFGALGIFEVLSTQVLDAVPDVVNTALLGKEELKQIDYWRPEAIGQILFNYWD